MNHTTERHLLRTILKGVSRSFYLTLAVLPSPVRPQIGLAYLLARAADTIADRGDIDQKIRLDCLHQLKALFVERSRDPAAVQQIQAVIGSRPGTPSEQALLRELPRCFALYDSLSPEDQSSVAKLLITIIGGMEFDQRQFPGGTVDHLAALKSCQELDDYTYAVAGCVGEFWTDMICRHLPRLRDWDRSVMIPMGIRYGKGLQLVNILRDVPHDLRRGRCYIPLALLEQVGLQPTDLLDERCWEQFRPISRQVILMARDHLDQGWCYTMAVPRSEIRLRLACMWPLLIGIRTLNLLMRAPTPLNPAEPVKVPRGAIYRMMAATTLTGGCGYLGTAYWGHLRKSIV